MYVGRLFYCRCGEVAGLRGKMYCATVLILEYPRSSILRNPFPEKKYCNIY
jgi:uncharacterized protein (DUF1330 family)